MNEYMYQALEQAKLALQHDEVPVGAVIVHNGKVIAKAYNRREKKQNALYHAELLAIDKACKKLKTFRLTECELYVTLEPCPMCAGAIINARLKKVIFGAYDHKRGCVGSIYNLLADNRFNHNPEIEGGVMQDECAEIMSNFFKTKRHKGDKTN